MYLSAVSTIPFSDRRRTQVRLESYVYGFNGQIKDNELYGEGNAYDFGARIYDPRLGRWLAMDPFTSKFPAESPFIFAGNIPTWFVDKGGMYKWPKNKAQEYTKTYPTLTKYLSKNIEDDVLGSTIIMGALLKHSGGNLTQTEVEKAVKWGSGPTIIIRDEPGGLKGAFGKYNPQTNTIEISTQVAQLLEQASPENKQAALLAVFSDILHETVHYGDYLDGLKMDDVEPGDAFEMDIFTSTLIEINGETEKIVWSKGVNVPDENWNLDKDKTIENAKRVILEKSQTREGLDMIPTVPTEEDK